MNSYLSQRYKSKTSNTASKWTKSRIVLGIVTGQPMLRHNQSNVNASFLLYCLANCKHYYNTTMLLQKNVYILQHMKHTKILHVYKKIYNISDLLVEELDNVILSSSSGFHSWHCFLLSTAVPISLYPLLSILKIMCFTASSISSCHNL